MKVPNSDLVFDIPAGNRGDGPSMVNAGLIRFDRPGVYHLRLGAADPATFKPVSLWQVQLSSGPVDAKSP